MLSFWRLTTSILILLYVVRQAKSSDITCVHCSEYELASAAEKEEVIFEKITSTEYGGREWFTLCQANERLKGLDFNNQMDRFSDERQEGFRRFFHESGIVATVEFVGETDHSFTGMFKGADHGVLRFSPLFPALKAEFLYNHFLGTFAFSFGLKLFRDGMSSADIVTGDTAKGLRAYGDSREFYDLPDFNIFSRPVDTMSGIGSLADVFGEFEKFSGVLSLAEVAAFDQTGMEETDPVTPFITHFEPNATLAEKFGRVREPDFRKWTTTEEAIPTGTPIYTVWTTIDRTGEPSLCVDDDGVPQVYTGVSTYCPGMSVVKLGTIKTTSRFYISQWVDDSLMFRHTRVCPKDQRTCTVNEGAEVKLSEPAPFYPDNQRFCLSTDDKSGELTGELPECPEGSTADGDYCFPGRFRQVEETQQSQCPFLNVVDISILGESVDDQGSTCDIFGVFQQEFLTLTLRYSSPVLRYIRDEFPAAFDVVEIFLDLFGDGS